MVIVRKYGTQLCVLEGKRRGPDLYSMQSFSDGAIDLVPGPVTTTGD